MISNIRTWIGTRDQCKKYLATSFQSSNQTFLFNFKKRFMSKAKKWEKSFKKDSIFFVRKLWICICVSRWKSRWDLKLETFFKKLWKLYCSLRKKCKIRMEFYNFLTFLFEIFFKSHFFMNGIDLNFECYRTYIV